MKMALPTYPLRTGEPCRLDDLHLESNGLTGEIPPSLGEPYRAETLNLSNNGLTGHIPAELGNLERLWT